MRDFDGVPVARSNVMETLWARKWLVIGAAAIGLLAAFVWLNFATYRFTAAIRVTPVQANTAALPGGLSSLASIAGVSVGRGEVAKPFVLYLQIVRGRTVATALAADERLMRHVFAQQWDVVTGQWRQPASLTRGLKDWVRRAVGAPVERWHKPGVAEVQGWLEKRLNVQEDPKNGLATLALDDPDPAFAVDVVGRIHATADEALRTRTLARTSRYIDYLQRTLATVTLAEHRAALAATLGDQEKQRMIASARNTPFAADPIGPAIASPEPTSPDPWLTLVAGILGGAAIGALGAINWPSRR